MRPRPSASSVIRYQPLDPTPSTPPLNFFSSLLIPTPHTPNLKPQTAFDPHRVRIAASQQLPCLVPEPYILHLPTIYDETLNLYEP